MKMIEVESSNIDAIGYNSENILRILFSSGVNYDYKNVPLSVYEEFLKVESKGSYFYRKIKNNFITLRVN